SFIFYDTTLTSILISFSIFYVSFTSYIYTLSLHDALPIFGQVDVDVILECLVHGYIIISFITAAHQIDHLIEALIHELVDFHHIVILDCIFRRIEVCHVPEQEPERVPDLAVHFGNLLEDII